MSDTKQPHPDSPQEHTMMERRRVLQALLGASAMGVGFAGFAKKALAREDVEMLAKAAGKAGFQPDLGPEIACRPIDEHKSGGLNEDCQQFTCDPSGTNGRFVCSNTSSTTEFDCTAVFTCPKFTCGHNDFGEECTEGGSPTFTCGSDPGPFNCLGSYT